MVLEDIVCSNLMCGSKLLHASKNCWSLVGPKGQWKKMSSMNLNHTKGFRVVCSHSGSSRRPINRFAYVGAILVPMAVPVCLM